MNAGLIDLCHWCSLAFILCSQFVKSTVQCHRKWRHGKGKKTVSVIKQKESRLWGLASCCSSLINFIVPRVFAARNNWLQTGSLFSFIWFNYVIFCFLSLSRCLHWLHVCRQWLQWAAVYRRPVLHLCYHYQRCDDVQTWLPGWAREQENDLLSKSLY